MGGYCSSYTPQKYNQTAFSHKRAARGVATRRDADIAHPTRPCRSLMSDNPPPFKYNVDQVVRDVASGTLRARRADEFTTASAAQAHERFILAAPIGVRLPCAQPQPVH